MAAQRPLMRRRPLAPVRYGSGDNKVLGMMLWLIRDSRCYWCIRPKLAHEVRIDRLIPRSTSAAC